MPFQHALVHGLCVAGLADELPEGPMMKESEGVARAYHQRRITGASSIMRFEIVQPGVVHTAVGIPGFMPRDTQQNVYFSLKYVLLGIPEISCFLRSLPLY